MTESECHFFFRSADIIVVICCINITTMYFNVSLRSRSNTTLATTLAQFRKFRLIAVVSTIVVCKINKIGTTLIWCLVVIRVLRHFDGVGVDDVV